MVSFVRQRLIQAIPVLIAVSIASFLLLYFLPGDPAMNLAGERATAADIERIRASLGLSDPLPVQYLRFVGNALQGEFGTSLRTQRSVAEEITSRLWATGQLALVAMVIASFLGIGLGMLAAYQKNTWIDALILVFSSFGICVPVFWLGLMGILFFGVQFKWLPTSGSGTLLHVIMPSVVLALAPLGTIARLTRTSMIEVLANDYVRTARAKGLSEWLVLRRHALRNGLIPAITIVGLQLGALLGGAVITETVFAWPGIGRQLVSAVQFRDFPVIRALILLFALIFVTVNILVDMLYAVIDPLLRTA
jgi:ABC-type dipeptide/oligopeptide/nickel transport system permease component